MNTAETDGQYISGVATQRAQFRGEIANFVVHTVAVTSGDRVRQAESISDVVERLLCEFEARVSLPVVAEVVLRLDQDRKFPLPVLMDRARAELASCPEQMLTGSGTQ